MHTFGLELMLRDLMHVTKRTGAHYFLQYLWFYQNLVKPSSGLGLAASVGVKGEPGNAVALQCQKLSRLKPPVLLWVSLRSGYFYLICAMASCFGVFPTSVDAIAVHAQQYPLSISGKRRGNCFLSSEMQKDEEGDLPLKRNSVVFTLDFVCKDFHF